MDVALLAKSLTILLSPFLPYLLKTGEKTAEAIGSKIGDDSCERAKALWSKLHPKVAAKPAFQEAAQDVAQAPEDEDAQASLRQQLKKLLGEDKALAMEITRLMQERQQAPGSTNISQQAGDNAVQFGQLGQAGDINIQR